MPSIQYGITIMASSQSHTWSIPQAWKPWRGEDYTTERWYHE